MSAQVYLATEDELIVWCVETQCLVRIVNTPEPVKYPTEGLLELTCMYMLPPSLTNSTTMTSMEILQKILENRDNWIRVATNYRDLDSATYDSEIENSLMIHNVLDETLSEEMIITSIDYINEDGLYSVGAYQYAIQFQKMIVYDPETSVEV